MTAITTTLFLPFIGLHVQPAMVGPQYVNIVWVNTPQDTWNDEDKDNNRRAINSALQWWEIHTFHRSGTDRKSTRLNSSHIQKSRMPSSA